ncbi:hypothetical protein BJ508DRAFT_64046 [Ascobolus immersus RN42]|uniref:Uncharacterized protein n=1 Tax=Ascobolus immersus RN42 TaxID=1160509 RepID=A0A3N4INL5_ASCIM|nr:hypothetical protein BJ508DRAFT_64046 [Ascobolus immersus RN42]
MSKVKHLEESLLLLRPESRCSTRKTQCRAREKEKIRRRRRRRRRRNTSARNTGRPRTIKVCGSEAKSFVSDRDRRKKTPLLLLNVPASPLDPGGLEGWYFRDRHDANDVFGLVCYESSERKSRRTRQLKLWRRRSVYKVTNVNMGKGGP